MQSTESTFPDFFADAPQITLRDPLAEFLGAARGGLMTYRYADAVRLAGHSCPTVAGAWLMTVRGLRALYGDETPVRGEVEVFMRGGREDGFGVRASGDRSLGQPDETPADILKSAFVVSRVGSANPTLARRVGAAFGRTTGAEIRRSRSRQTRSRCC